MYRLKSGSLRLSRTKPIKDSYGIWQNEDCTCVMGYALFPEVTFENSPQEVELVLPSQEPTIGNLLEQLIETKKEMRKFREMVSRMRDVQKTYTSYESVFGKAAKGDLICKEADVDKWVRETEETEFDD